LPAGQNFHEIHHYDKKVCSMMKKQEVIERMCQSGILPVFRTDDLRHLFPASRAYYDAGIGCVEYTTSMPGILDLVREGAASLPKDLLLGAGTVLDGKTVEMAVKAGAQFIASRALAPKWCRRARPRAWSAWWERLRPRKSWRRSIWAPT
jgi:2-keto-3-deoxy-6-phosphogluconate aldolase